VTAANQHALINGSFININGLPKGTNPINSVRANQQSLFTDSEKVNTLEILTK